MPSWRMCAASRRAAARGARGRLIFALDATMSRQPTWDTACRLQADMFREAAAIGGLDVQLVYYRGLAECRASGWVSEADRLADLMERIDCRGGHTQIGKVLAPCAARDAKHQGAGAGLRRRRHGGVARRSLRGGGRARAARRAGLHVPGRRTMPVAEQAFREIARLTRGAYCRFDPGAAHELARAAARGGGLCGRRHRALPTFGAPRRRRGAAARADAE